MYNILSPVVGNGNSVKFKAKKLSAVKILSAKILVGENFSRHPNSKI